MVVTVIIAVLAGMTLMSSGGTGTAALRSSAGQLLHAAQYAHGYAATRGVACRLVFDAKERRFYLERERDATEAPGEYEVMTEEGMRPVTLPAGVEFGAVRIEASGAAGAMSGSGAEAGMTPLHVVTFRPTGEADAAAVELKAGERVWTLRVAPATGRCELSEGPAGEMLTDRMDLDV